MHLISTCCLFSIVTLIYHLNIFGFEVKKGVVSGVKAWPKGPVKPFHKGSKFEVGRIQR